MASALKIDTLKLADDLEAAKGDPRQTARVIGKTIGTIDISELATKSDVAEAKAELKQDIADVKAEIGEVKSELKTDILKVENKIVEVKGEIAEVKAELKTEIALSTNKAIYTLGGLVTVLFVLDRIIPLFGVAN